MNNEELIAILEDALRYVHGSYECAFPDEQENQDVADSVVQAINRLKAEAEPDFIEQVDANTIDFLRDALDVTSARIAVIEAENQRLTELLAIEKDVSEGALIANQLSFNVDKSVNDSLNKLVKHVMNTNQELRNENQRLRDANRWIPVREGLPEVEGEFWVTISRTPTSHSAHFVCIDLFDGDEFNALDVIAWRELPALYQEDV